jgi:hypothetical protein
VLNYNDKSGEHGKREAAERPGGIGRLRRRNSNGFGTISAGRASKGLSDLGRLLHGHVP